jgi:peptidoglycan/xylan/chitin deacetylase (PgdA/CDA1 family)
MLGPVASAEALKALDPRRVRLGSHSVSHPRLAELDDIRLQTELTASKSTLERITGTRVALLALPYGSCSPRVIAAAERAGYERIFANVPIVRAIDSLLAGRVDVSPRDWPLEFRMKALGAYEWMALAVPAKREMLRVFGRPQAA